MAGSHLSIIVVSSCRTGEVINGLLGEKIVTEDEDLDDVGGKQEYSIVKINGVNATVYNFSTSYEYHGSGIEADLVLYCISMSDTRCDMRPHNIALERLHEGFGSAVWEKTVFVLTHANMYVHQLRDLNKPVDENFRNKVQQWRSKIQGTLTRVGACQKIMDSIQVHPAGALRIHSLPGHAEYWLSDLWGYILTILKENAQLAFYLTSHKRLLTKKEVVNADFGKLVQNHLQPIVYTKVVKEAIESANGAVKEAAKTANLIIEEQAVQCHAINTTAVATATLPWSVIALFVAFVHLCSYFAIKAK